MRVVRAKAERVAAGVHPKQRVPDELVVAHPHASGRAQHDAAAEGVSDAAAAHRPRLHVEQRERVVPCSCRRVVHDRQIVHWHAVAQDLRMASILSAQDRLSTYEVVVTPLSDSWQRAIGGLQNEQ